MIKKFVAFLGPVRNGHTLIASLLSVHKNIAISIELNPVFKLFDRDYTRKMLVDAILKNCATRKSVDRGGYDYTVAGSYQFCIDDVTIIGDSMAGVNQMKRLSTPSDIHKFQKMIGLQVKWILLHRDPFDVIQSSNTMNDGGLDYNISHFKNTMEATENARKLPSVERNLFVFHLEDFTDNPRKWLKMLTNFLGVKVNKKYLDHCCAMVFKKPNKSFDREEWSDKQFNDLNEFIKTIPDLERYVR